MIKSRLISHVGVSYDVSTPQKELEKALAAIDAGADIIADASVGKNAYDTIKILCENISVPIYASPGYILATGDGNASIPENCTKKDILFCIENVLKLGVSGITIHATFNNRLMLEMEKNERVFPFTSRMGGYILEYMKNTQNENPFYLYIDEIIDLCYKYSVSVSFGLALRSPSVTNDYGIDELFKKEILETKKLIEKCIDKNVDYSIECGGHIAISRMIDWVNFVKDNCYNAKMKVLVVPTDRSMGHDCVSGAIAAAYMCQLGVEMICVITRAEHISLPLFEDIVESVIYFRIALDSICLNMKEERIIAKARSQGGCHLPEIFPSLIDKIGAKREVSLRVADKNIITEDIDVGKHENCTMCGISCPLKKYVNLRG